MINQIPLFFDNQQNRYFYVGFCSCVSCDAILKDVVIIKRSWSKKSSDFGLYCLSCFNKQKDSFGIIKEIIGAKIVLERPDAAYPVIIQPPSVKDYKNNETIFSMAVMSVDGEETQDSTKIAGRDCFDGSEQIGLSPEMVEDKNKLLSVEEADAFLDEAFKSVPFVDADSLDYKKDSQRLVE